MTDPKIYTKIVPNSKDQEEGIYLSSGQKIPIQQIEYLVLSQDNKNSVVIMNGLQQTTTTKAPEAKTSDPLSAPLKTPYLQAVDTRSKPAFQSVESMISSVVSMGAMLQVAYKAFHSSFRAIIIMWDNCAIARQRLAKFFKIEKMLKLLKISFSGIMYILKYFKIDRVPCLISQILLPSKTSLTAIFALFGIGFGIPFLTRKLLDKSSRKECSPDHFSISELKCICIAGIIKQDIHSTNPDELSVTGGEIVIIPIRLNQKNTEWFIAYKKNGASGFIPVKYVTLINRFFQISSGITNFIDEE